MGCWSERVRVRLEATLRCLPARLLALFIGALTTSACSGAAAGGVLGRPAAVSPSQYNSGEAKGDRLYLSALPTVTEYAVSGKRHHALCRNRCPR